MIVRLFFALAFLATASAQAQEIRRAIPVDPPVAETPAANPEVAGSPGIDVAPYVQSAPAVSALVNETARFLAGLPISADSPLAPLEQTAAWQEHAHFFDQAWTKLAARQFSGIRDWEVNYLPDATQPLATVFYLFSGPDFLYANQFYPNATTYILAGTEPIGSLPEVLRFAGPALGPILQNLQKSLNSVLSFSFFITKDMKSDLEREELKGTLPIFYVFLARANKTITDVSFINLDKSGQLQTTVPDDKRKSITPGVRLIFTGAPGTPPQTLYYFTTDLSNDGIRNQPGFLKFCATQGTGASLLKSASYLMFENGFGTVRDFLLNHSKAIVQDDSGIPIAALDPAQWSLRFFGSYPGPIDLFKQHYQPQLQSLFQLSNPAPLGFGIGYRWSPRQSTLIVATRKATEISPLSPGLPQ